jgi:hypothetical protein
MSLIDFPNVPDLPGVPSVARSAQYPAAARVALGAVQGALWRSAQVSSQWGIWDDKGNPVGNPDRFTGLTAAALQAIGVAGTLSTGSVDYSKEFRVADFPVEGGTFATYNKVELPGVHSVMLVYGGSEAERSAFITAIDAASRNTRLYTVMTPEAVYDGFNISRYAYSRKADRGANLIIMEIELREVREVSAQFSTTVSTLINAPKDATSTPQVDTGTVQAKTPDKSTLLKAVEKFSNVPSLEDLSSYVRGLIK